jgi:carbon-monoxide dehydrogenase medium subunit
MIHDFTYLRPSSLKEALTMLAEHKDECKVICGGQSLLIIMRQGLLATDYLVDIKHIKELDYIQFDAKSGLKIGATTTHHTIETSDVIKKNYPILVAMENKLASIQVRNWGTIGGNLAHADPAGDPGPVLMALNANIKVGSAQGERTMALEDFSLDFFETALEEGEIVLEVQVPVPEAKTGAAYQKFNLLESDQGMVGVAAAVTLNGGGKCKDVRVVLGNAGPKPILVKKIEELLIGKTYDEKLFAEAGKIASEDCEPVSDIHASEEHRRHLLGVLTKRMLKQAWEQAKG